MFFRGLRYLVLGLFSLTFLVAGLGASVYGVLLLVRPSKTPHSEALFKGVTYTRTPRTSPRPMMVHTVEVDLTAEGIRPFVTPGDASRGMEFLARTTSEVLEIYKLQLAVNGSFCRPAYHNGPFDYYPHSGDPVELIGQSISKGIEYSAPQGKTPVLCFSESGEASIHVSRCPESSVEALAGNRMIVTRGKPRLPNDSPAEPRSAVAIDQQGQHLWIIVVDGRQDGYSEGATYANLAEIALELGAYQALNLDGGGSSALVVADGSSASLLNSPINARVPMRERPVPNHLGFFASPLEE